MRTPSYGHTKLHKARKENILTFENEIVLILGTRQFLIQGETIFLHFSPP